MNRVNQICLTSAILRKIDNQDLIGFGFIPKCTDRDLVTVHRDQFALGTQYHRWRILKILKIPKDTIKIGQHR
jgi:hypothetical protein